MNTFKSCKLAFGLLIIVSLSGCATTYASKRECEKSEAAFRGRTLGFIVAAATSDAGRQVVRVNNEIVVKNGPKGSAGSLVLGTLIGHVLGAALHEPGSDQTEAEQKRYESKWFGPCTEK